VALAWLLEEVVLHRHVGVHPRLHVVGVHRLWLGPVWGHPRVHLVLGGSSAGRALLDVLGRGGAPLAGRGVSGEPRPLVRGGPRVAGALRGPLLVLLVLVGHAARQARGLALV